MKHFVAILILMVILASCKKTNPQLPSNKNNAQDTTALTLQAIQNRLSEREDSLLNDIAKTQTIHFVKDSAGYWLWLNSEGHGGRLKRGEKCTITIHYFTLEGEMLEAEKTAITVGKREKTVVVDLVLEKMRRGQKAIILAPWYLAYGTKGNGKTIVGFSSLRIELELAK